ncbi:MAG: hypothetical protein UR26_C0003G0019 [candidate division TM6 bacterium GW2011_GWF2_32_72]|nr:MAG: hypothetical protein UR26_C0003G0019 [candidate division TM6 bacterium GW2011_GWF2_32_72]
MKKFLFKHFFLILIYTFNAHILASEPTIEQFEQKLKDLTTKLNNLKKQLEYFSNPKIIETKKLLDEGYKNFKSNQPNPHFSIPVKQQDNSWSCGYHAAKNAVALANYMSTNNINDLQTLQENPNPKLIKQENWAQDTDLKPTIETAYQEAQNKITILDNTTMLSPETFDFLSKEQWLPFQNLKTPGQWHIFIVTTNKEKIPTSQYSGMHWITILIINYNGTHVYLEADSGSGSHPQIVKNLSKGFKLPKINQDETKNNTP